MNYGNLVNKLDTEEGKKKAESLFSKKFIEYLSSKKLTPGVEKTPSRSYNPNASFHSKDTSASSDDTSSQSSKKSNKKAKKKIKHEQSHWDFKYGHRNKLTQCSLLKCSEEVAPPEELRQLLVNMTIILQELKQPKSELNNLFDLITRVTILITEFIRRPLKKIEEGGFGNYSKNMEKTAEEFNTLLDDYKSGLALEPDSGIREYKTIEREVANRKQEIAALKSKISEVDLKLDLKTKDVTERVKNSILANEKLKNEIKFNRGQLKKFKKVLVEREWSKRKIETELTNLKKKSSKIDFCDDFSLQEFDLEKKNVLKKTSSHAKVKGKKSREKSKLDIKIKSQKN